MSKKPEETKNQEIIKIENHEQLNKYADFTGNEEPIIRTPEGEFQLQHEYHCGNYCGSNWVKVG